MLWLSASEQPGDFYLLESGSGVVVAVQEKNRNLPQLGQGPIDFESFDEVLTYAAGTNTCVSRFVHAFTGSLRRLGHEAAAAKYG